jgi:hypothetical protein
MQRFIPIFAAVALTVALAPLISSAWTNPSVAGGPLPTISVEDLTLAEGQLPTLDYYDAH